jgi:uncharacterized membrane protein YeaQ/YmgE (transglycosylase-associated protein family)
MMNNVQGLLKWPVRGTLTGLTIGLIVGPTLALVSASWSPLLLIGLDPAFGFVLGLLAAMFVKVFVPWLSTGVRQRRNRIIQGAIYGVMAGAIVLMPLSSGWRMAVLQAVEGAIVGGLLGIFAGTIWQMSKGQSRRLAPEL